MSTRNKRYEEAHASMLPEKILLILAALFVLTGAVMGFIGLWHFLLLFMALAILSIMTIIIRTADSGSLKKWVVFVLALFAAACFISFAGLMLLTLEKFLLIVLPSVLLLIFATLGIALVISGIKNRDSLTMIIGFLFIIIAILVIAIILLFENII